MKWMTIALITLLWCNSYAQSPEEPAVKNAVNQLFTAMMNADPALLKNSFTDSAVLQTIVEKEGKITVRNEQVADFAASVSKWEKNTSDERIRFDVVRIDGPLASVWTPYRFYFKGKFIHCGADSFQLVKINGSWKIQYLVDTRRTDCKE